MVVNGHALLKKAPIRDMLCLKLSRHGASYGLAEVGYDIRLKQDIRFQPRTDKIAMDRIAIQGELLKFGRFCIASAIEEFDMPSDLVGIVHDKSTWARKGLSVFNTVIEPGWRGFLTLELVYHGSEELHLAAGTGIAQVLFHQITEPASYAGKYQNQEDRPVGAKLQADHYPKLYCDCGGPFVGKPENYHLPDCSFLVGSKSRRLPDG